MDGTRTIFAFALSIIVGMCSGCHKQHRYPEASRDSFRPVAPPYNEQVAFDPASVEATPPYAVMDRYPIRALDRITFTLSVDPLVQTQEYHLMVNDELTVQYLHLPDSPVTRTRILADGSINLPEIGRVGAAGKTVQELTDEIQERAKEFFRRPKVSVVATQALGRAEEIRKSFSTGFTNQSLTLTVTADGYVDLPEIGRVRAFGKLLPDLRDEINARYHRVAPGVMVWPSIEQRAEDRVYVLGQVGRPGEIRLDRPHHVSQVIALAGGYTIGSKLHDVFLVRYHEGAPRVIRLNIDQAIWQDLSADDVVLTDDILVADGDVIVVPRNKLQRNNDLIRQLFTDGAYGIIPIPRTTER